MAATANYALTTMYWHIGERINREILGNERAEYGKQIVSQVAKQLQTEYGKKGFELRNIWRMMQFAQTFPDFQIVSPLVSKLSWTHFLIVMSLKDELQREFYLTMAAVELDKSGIKVAQYLTEMPPRHVLMHQIHKALESAKGRVDNSIVDDDSGD